MSTFRADCDRCCSLCCVVSDHLAVQGFRIDKPAETPCTHLDEQHRCSIHAVRQAYGFPACEGFDCHGAGQWVTQSLFGGARWTDSPELAARMFTAYRYWVPRFEIAALIEAALPHVREEARRLLIAKIKQLIATDASACTEDAARLRRETLAAIRSALRR